MQQRILLVCDRPSWAYDAIAQALIKHNSDPDLCFDTAFVKAGDVPIKEIYEEYDAVFVLGWQLMGEIQHRKLARFFPGIPQQKIGNQLPYLSFANTLTGIHSHHAWDDRQTQPDLDFPPPEPLVNFLKKFQGVNVVSRRLHRIFDQAGLDVDYTPNGVDIELFRPIVPLRNGGPLRVGFSGNKKHDWRKGISEYIEPASHLPGVELKLAMPQDGQYVPLSGMPRFYNEIDVYICASSSEGFSLSVLEAAACGRPIISTRVGGSEDLIEDGVNGFLVDRDVDAIKARVAYYLENRQKVLEMGMANRAIVEERWSWEKRAPAWIEFIKARMAG